MFSDYLKLGMDHILDPNGYDHILFVTVLCALYQTSQWKKVIILVTAFTLGHSLTLAMASLDLVSFNPTLIEILIPITIILTGFYNLSTLFSDLRIDKGVPFHYLLALLFGLIHGLGFSNYFKAIMGTEDSILMPLFAFNVGVEVGQIFIVTIVMALGYLLSDIFKLPKKYWTGTISVMAIIVATYLLYR